MLAGMAQGAATRRHGGATGLRAVVMVGAVALATGGCVDKPFRPPATVPGGALAIQLVTEASQAAGRSVRVTVGYSRSSGAVVSLLERTEAVAGGTQQLSLPVDLTPCLADSLRAGSREGCTVRIGIALRDAAALPLDTVTYGPLDLIPGRVPTLPPAEMAINRYAARSFVSDRALEFGPSQTFNSVNLGLPVSAVPTPGGEPTLYSFSVRGRDFFLIRASAATGWTWEPLAGAALETGNVSVSAVSNTEVWVATAGAIRRWNGPGTSFTTFPFPVSEVFNAISALTVGTRRIVMASTAGGVIYQNTDSTFGSWIGTPLGDGTERINGLCVSAADEAFAATIGGRLYRWNGSTWTLTSQPPAFTNSMVNLQCPGGRGVAFVTAFQQGFLRWNGIQWEPVPGGNPFPGSLTVYSAASATDIWGFFPVNATERRYARWNNGTWTVLPFSNAFAQGPGSWFSDPSGRLYLRSSFGHFERIDGNGRALLSYVPHARDVEVVSPTSAFAVGWNLFLARYDGARWVVDPPPTGTSTVRILQDVSADAPDNAWVVGNGATILRWNGTAWTVVSDLQRPQVAGDNYTGVFARGNIAIATGNQGLTRCEGATCARMASPASDTLFGIWGTSLGNVWAVGRGGRILRFDGSAWSDVPSPTTRTLRRVHGSAANDVWAVGDSVVVRFDGTAWRNLEPTGALATALSGPPTTQLTVQLGVWSGGPRDVYVGASGGRIVRFDGTSWQSVPTGGTTSRILALSGVPGQGVLGIVDTFEPTASVPALLRGAGANGLFSSAFPGTTGWR